VCRVTNERSRDGAAQATGPVREIRDDQGRRWLVREIDGPTYDRRSSRSLILDRHATVRRVRSFPAYWNIVPHADM
jgi:hypothetical protein